MTKRVGFLGLMAAAAVALFQPAVMSAQDRYDYQRGHEQREYHDYGRDHRRGDRDGWRGDRDDYRREYRDGQYRDDRYRAEEWRDHYGYARRYAPVYPYGYVAPAPGFSFGWYGR